MANCAISESISMETTKWLYILGPMIVFSFFFLPSVGTAQRGLLILVRCLPSNASLISPQSSITFVFRQKSFKLLLYELARAGHGSGVSALLLLAHNYFYYLLRIEGRDDYVVTGQYSLCSLFSPINRKAPLTHTHTHTICTR